MSCFPSAGHPAGVWCRFTWWDLVAEPDRVVREVREALARGSRIA